MPTAAGLYYFAGGSPSDLSVILLHDIGGCSLSWPAEIRHLPIGRIFALDLPGHGKSEKAGRQSVEEYAQDVVAFVQSMNLDKAFFIGYGLGGAIALEIAYQCRNLIAGLAILAGGERLPISPLILENAAVPFALPLAIRRLMEQMAGPQTRGHVLEALEAQLSANRPSVLYGDLLACESFRAKRGLFRLHLPVLIVYGSEDHFVLPAYSRSLAAKLPNAALQSMDGAGHLFIAEQPHRVASLLHLFLASYSDS